MEPADIMKIGMSVDEAKEAFPHCQRTTASEWRQSKLLP